MRAHACTKCKCFEPGREFLGSRELNAAIHQFSGMRRRTAAAELNVNWVIKSTRWLPMLIEINIYCERPMSPQRAHVEFNYVNIQFAQALIFCAHRETARTFFSHSVCARWIYINKYKKKRSTAAAFALCRAREKFDYQWLLFSKPVCAESYKSLSLRCWQRNYLFTPLPPNKIYFNIFRTYQAYTLARAQFL